MAGVLNSVAAVLIISAAILTILPEFGFNVTPVEAVAAVVEAWPWASARKHLSRTSSTASSSSSKTSLATGDTIQLNQEIGRSRDSITLRRTVLRNIGGAMVTIPNSLVGQVANLSRDWSQTFIDVSIPSDQPTDAALTALERVATDFRADAAWSPALVDGPRVLGIESLSLDGTLLRLQVRTAPNRRDDVARELRRRIRLAFEQANIPLGATHNISWQQAAPSPPLVK